MIRCLTTYYLTICISFFSISYKNILKDLYIYIRYDYVALYIKWAV